MGRIRSYLDMVDERYKHHINAKNVFVSALVASVITLLIEAALVYAHSF